MAGPFERSRCILLVCTCLAAGAAGAAAWPGARIYAGLGSALATSLVALVCLNSRLRAAHGALQRANRAKSEFMANVSHELRTPLNGMHGLAELLSHECAASERQQMAAAIQASCQSLMSAVDQILDYARIEKGDLTAGRAPFDVRAAVEEAAAVIAPKARDKGLAFEIAVGPEVPRSVLGDVQRVREVLRYLLDNAVKFTYQGKVRLEVSVGGDPIECNTVLFRVCDTGSGIEPKVAVNLFTAFTQGDAASTRAHGGLGLGLTLAHRLVGLMGGSIGVESCRDGSVFWFLLPVVAVEPGPGDATAPFIESHGGRVLVVDDNAINQLVAVRALHSLGYAADAVASGEAGLEVLCRTSYDAVLMDCQMPGMDGFQAASEIRRREATGAAGHIPIIAMTANGPGSDREQCLASGMDDYLAKPFRIADLNLVLERWIAVGEDVPEAG